MKKIFLILAIGLLFAACSNDDSELVVPAVEELSEDELLERKLVGTYTIKHFKSVTTYTKPEAYETVIEHNPDGVTKSMGLLLKNKNRAEYIEKDYNKHGRLIDEYVYKTKWGVEDGKLWFQGYLYILKDPHYGYFPWTIKWTEAEAEGEYPKLDLLYSFRTRGFLLKPGGKSEFDATAKMNLSMIKLSDYYLGMWDE